MFVALPPIHLKNLFTLTAWCKELSFILDILEVTISTEVGAIGLNYMPNCIEFQI